MQQRYGIHLATRIQKDDVHGKQANWADIDDDDDDWAPDSMEWADGTKITLPQADEHPPPAPIPEPAAVLKEPTPPPEPVKPKSPAPPQPSASPIIKPGGLGSGRTGLVLKGASEKPTLVAKPPGPPAPVKSPWASLPPVDKPVPIVVDIPHQQQPQQNRFGRNDPHGFQGMPPPPAKEIAADDFSRTWREGNSNSNRELYDSKSGRYEPVNDNRRGSRNDARHSLLQRPSHDGPAEPSAAFQTHRAPEHNGYGRRRTSSNVSGGSGFMRRMSRGHDMPPPHELLALGPRRGSLAAVSDDPSSPGNFSPSGQNHSQRGYQNQQWQSRASPALSHPSPMSVHVQPVLPPAQAEIQPAVPYEDPIEEQKKIMRASRELAIKRRQDTEAKEEAEKKERLRLKLEAMGPPPEKKSKKETPKEEKVNPVPVQIQARTPSIEKSLDVIDLPKASSTADEQLVTSKIQDGAEIRANGETIVPPLNDTHPAPPENQTSQKWQNASSSGSDRYQPWAPQPTQQTSRNVWGPPSNDRTLGNGTFSQDLGGLPEMPSSNPGPIGPPNRGNGFQRGGRDQTLSRPAPIGPPNQRVRPTPDPRVAASPWANHEQYMREDERKRREENVQAEKRRLDLESKGMLPVEPVVQDTWRQVGLNEDGTRTKILANHTTIHDDNKTTSVKGVEEASRPVFDERAISEEQDLSRRRQFDSVGTQPRQPDTWAAPSRSRFFPSQDVRFESRHTEEHTINSYDRPGSPSPPPPTMPGHPVYGDNAFPQVSFPKPPPVVKLPPPTVLAPIGPPRPTSFAAAVSTPISTPVRQTHISQDVRRHEVPSGGWQDRINTLIGRRSSPPRTHALQVDSSSKNALELPPTQFTATVSLPSSVTGDLSFDDGSVLSKPAAEECFEEQEMGSLPIVRVPSIAPPLAWDLAPAPKQLSRNLGHFDIVSIPDHSRPAFGPHFVNNTLAVSIKLPGQENTTTVTMNAPHRYQNRRGGGGGGRGPRQNNSSRAGSGRGRNDGRDGRQDSGRDGGRDIRQESGRDGGRDIRQDSGRDGGRDNRREAGRDSGRDVGRDIGFQAPAITDSSRGVIKGGTYKSTPWTL